MGYTHGTRWDNQKIESEIKKVMRCLGIDRMPSNSEIRTTTGSHSLTMAISKRGGMFKWANKMGLEIKQSETYFGHRYECIAKNLLEDRGYIVEKMAVKHPFDLYVNGAVKVDVKAAKPYTNPDVGTFHTFNLEKKEHACDIFMMFAVSADDEIEKLLIIPSNKLEIRQLSIGVNSRYDKYVNRWDYFDKYANFMNGIN